MNSWKLFLVNLNSFEAQKAQTITYLLLEGGDDGQILNVVCQIFENHSGLDAELF